MLGVFHCLDLLDEHTVFWRLDSFPSSHIKEERKVVPVTSDNARGSEVCITHTRDNGQCSTCCLYIVLSRALLCWIHVFFHSRF
jgi:hypothetical protein